MQPPGLPLLGREREQEVLAEAVSGLMNLVMLPQWLFSGVFFSSTRFGDAAQPFIQALPLTQLAGGSTTHTRAGAPSRLQPGGRWGWWPDRPKANQPKGPEGSPVGTRSVT